MDPSSEVLVDYPPVFRIYKDRSIDRLIADDSVPAGLDTATGVTSKDVTIDGDAGVYVRLYLPAMASPDDGRKLPVVVYYHGGGFVAMSAASWVYQGFLNSLAARAGVLVVSVNYRLAPEHPFPVGYEDSLRALEWAVAPGSDPWLSRHGDLGRLFLTGDSAGGNIAHNVAMLPAAARMKIEGVVLLHPAFWGREPIAGETPEVAALMENLWGVVCPETAAADGTGTDDPRMNPLAAAAPSLRRLPCRRLLVCAADGDFLRQRGRAYYEGVAASGWGGAVEWFESKDAVHCFFFHEPECGEAVALMDRLVDFITGEAKNA